MYPIRHCVFFFFTAYSLHHCVFFFFTAYSSSSLRICFITAYSLHHCVFFSSLRILFITVYSSLLFLCKLCQCYPHVSTGGQRTFNRKACLGAKLSARPPKLWQATRVKTCATLRRKRRGHVDLGVFVFSVDGGGRVCLWVYMCGMGV